MSARLITLANSALFGSGRNETQNWRDTLVPLRMRQVTGLVYTLEVTQYF
jgi:HD-like signal output (HDOD) protein